MTEQEEDELYEHFRFVIDKGQEPIRIDKYITEKLSFASRNKVQQAIDSGNVLVNDKKTKSNYKLRGNDVIQIVLPTPSYDYTVQAKNIPLDIIYEDEELMVINKPIGMVVHPGHGNYTGTLVHALLWHCKTIANKDDETRPGLVHRIDKNTTGLMVIGKTEHAINHLSKQFFDRTIERNYIALVWGDIDEEKGRIETYIGRNPKNRKLYKCVKDESEGKYAATNYEVIRRFGYVTLIRCKLETGRTHQIRVHLKHIGHTLFGDDIYGGHQILAGTVYTKYKQFIQNCLELMPYQALHAQSIGFVHPTTHKKLYFEQELPDNFLQLLAKWETYTKSFNI
jgi:23S rRNA pseudouridine1911/1915/1917 synthase